jgi:adenosylcobinamide kinase / adenosylcobinamide-phosphate guanylyltransferase
MGAWMTVSFVLGGARSGKSAFAQARAEAAAAAAGVRPLMIVTAQAFDEEMSDRIARHQADRGEAWRTLEAPLTLAAAVRDLGAEEVAVIDCLTLWLTNLMLGEHEVGAAVSELCAALSASPADIHVVSNEVGLGIVPENALARRFRDEAGRLNRLVAALADEAVVLFAGLPLFLKPRAAHP